LLGIFVFKDILKFYVLVCIVTYRSTDQGSMKNNNKSNKKSKAISKPLGKRWFVAASGWGLSLDAGSDNPQTRQQKREIPIPMDSKMYNDGSIVANTSFLHNTVYTANPLNGIVYSNLDNGRVGDFIHIKQMSLKFSLDTASNTTVSTPIIVRCMLVVVTDESTQAAFGSGIGSTSVFSQYTTSQLIAARSIPSYVRSFAIIWLMLHPLLRLLASRSITLSVRSILTLSFVPILKLGLLPTYIGCSSRLFLVVQPVLLK